ncbi:MAG: hypothetical protein LQ349_007965 [Xanthoria aureola]|nr:MAG: hypothetical protein LQ349_007965 [Xanthoria aureola]
MTDSAPKKGRVCLAYSGGLDTSCILKWLINQGYEVICFLADCGQEEDFKAAEQKAMKVGAKKVYIEDIKKEFVEEFCWPAIQCNANYETLYLLGTSLARPPIARAQIRVAQKEGCFAVSHGCTGKGNDQVRFELAFQALQPGIKIIAPWRDSAFLKKFAGGRNSLLEYASQQGIPVTSTKSKPWSMDENLAHCSYEAGILEDPNTTPPADMWKLTVDPKKAPDEEELFTVEFTKGIPSKLQYTENGKSKTVTDAVGILTAANTIGRRNGVGRIDIVENRFIGIKSRGCYETPGLTCLHLAHLDLEGLCMDREVRALRDQYITIAYGKVLYNGHYFSPQREFLHAGIVASQKAVTGTVRCGAYKGHFRILGREAPMSKLYDMEESSMDDIGDFDPAAAGGFIDVEAIRLRKYGVMKKEAGEDLV